MRLVWLAALGLVTLAPAPAGAAFWRQRPQAPWCAVYSLGFGETRWECIYPTLESCVPTILAGTRGFCNPNPRYQAPEPPAARQKALTFRTKGLLPSRYGYGYTDGLGGRLCRPENYRMRV